MDWTQKKCVPCEGGVPELEERAVADFLRGAEGWSHEGHRLHKHFRFRDFVSAMRFVNAMADLAEREGHHPDFSVRYAAVDVELWTHSIGGLSENDLVLAAKIDALPRDPPPEARTATAP